MSEKLRSKVEFERDREFLKQQEIMYNFFKSFFALQAADCLVTKRSFKHRARFEIVVDLPFFTRSQSLCRNVSASHQS